jgi:hypothetical protein
MINKRYFGNAIRNKCRLTIGSTFIFRGDYCIVNRMFYGCFQYIVQETQTTCYMSYKNYLTTPSAAGRQLNR